MLPCLNDSLMESDTSEQLTSAALKPVFHPQLLSDSMIGVQANGGMLMMLESRLGRASEHLYSFPVAERIQLF